MIYCAERGLRFTDMRTGVPCNPGTDCLKPKQTKPSPFVALDAEFDPGERQWLVPGILQFGQLTGVIAAGGTGKSALSIHLALMVATQSKFCHWQARHARKVLIVASEDDLAEQERRMIAARAIMCVTLDDYRGQVLTLAKNTDLALFRRDKDGKLEFTDLYGQIRATIEKENIGLLIIDPFVEIARGFNENSNDDVAEVVSILRSVARDSKLAIMVVHHARKGSSNGSQDAARGASAFVNMCRYALNLERMSEDEAKRMRVSSPQRYIRVDSTKANYAARDATRWLELVSVDLESGESAPGIQSANLEQAVGAGASWAVDHKDDILELVTGGHWFSSQRAPKAKRLESALAERYDLQTAVARDAVEHAEAAGWIVPVEVNNRGRAAHVWGLPPF
jgi:hypothetical protein